MGEKINHTPHGENIEEIESPKSTTIHTLDQLLKAARVDLEVWEVTNWIANKWEVAGKGGDRDDPFFIVQPLWQVKATLRRKKLRPSFPTLRPIAVNRTNRKISRPRFKSLSGIKTALILPDPHFGYRVDAVTGDLVPFHDMRALDVVLQVAYELRPHYVIHLGDILDLAEWSSKFTVLPEYVQTTQPAVIAANWWLGRIRDSSPGSSAVLLEGNHDRRMEQTVINNLKASYGLRPADELDLPPALSVPRLLALDSLGIDYRGTYPNGEHWLTDSLMCQHGNIARKGGGKSAAAAVKDFDVSVMFGHTHRLERAMRTAFSGERIWTVGAYSCGCLCHIDGRVPGVKARQDWQQGFAVAYYDDKEASVLLYEIRNGRVLFGDRLYTGTDRTGVMEQDTGWKFRSANGSANRPL